MIAIVAHAGSGRSRIAPRGALARGIAAGAIGTAVITTAQTLAMKLRRSGAERTQARGRDRAPGNRIRGLPHLPRSRGRGAGVGAGFALIEALSER